MILCISPISFLRATFSKFCQPHQRIFKEDLSLCLRMERECLPVFMVPIIQPELLGQADAVGVPSATGHEGCEGSNCDLFPSVAPAPPRQHGSSHPSLSPPALNQVPGI